MTPSFVAEFPVGTTPADRRELRIRLFAETQIYNASLGEALSRLDRMRCSLDYRRAVAMPSHAGKKADGTPKPIRARCAVQGDGEVLRLHVAGDPGGCRALLGCLLDRRTRDVPRHPDHEPARLLRIPAAMDTQYGDVDIQNDGRGH